MDHEKFSYLFNMRAILRSMEKDLGLDDLSKVELDVLMSAHNLTQTLGQVISSRDIRSHALIKAVPSATFHRALVTLVEGGYIRKADDKRTKNYIVAFQ